MFTHTLAEFCYFNLSRGLKMIVKLFCLKNEYWEWKKTNQFNFISSIIALTWGSMSRGFKLVFASHYKKCHLNIKMAFACYLFFSLSLSLI